MMGHAEIRVKMTRKAIEEAAREYLADSDKTGFVRNAGSHGSHTFWLLYQGEQLPMKAICARALQITTGKGKASDAKAGQFAAVLKEHGFEIVNEVGKMR